MLFNDEGNVKKMLIIITIILGLIIYYQYFYDGTDYIKSNIDGNYYRVRNKNQRKADLLAMQSPELKQYLKDNNIVLTTWRELMQRRKALNK